MGREPAARAPRIRLSLRDKAETGCVRACLGNNVYPCVCKTCLLPKAETGRVAFGFGRRWFSLLGARSFANSGWRRVKLQPSTGSTRVSACECEKPSGGWGPGVSVPDVRPARSVSALTSPPAAERSTSVKVRRLPFGLAAPAVLCGTAQEPRPLRNQELQRSGVGVWCDAGRNPDTVCPSAAAWQTES